MSLTFEELSAVVTEIREFVQNSIVDNVKQCDDDSLILNLYGRSGSVRLYITSKRGFVRLHLLDSYQPQCVNRAGHPPAFQMKLRKELKGARIKNIRIPGRDRVVIIDFYSKDRTLKLLFEATGHHPNIFLLDQDEVILAMIKPNTSKKRDLAVGKKYIFPLPVARQVSEGFRFFDKSIPVYKQVEDFYAKQEEQDRRLRKAVALRKRLKSLIAHEVKKLENIEKELDRAKQAVELFKKAELLKTNLDKIKGKRLKEVELIDENGEMVKIQLDPRLTPVQNLQRMFKRAKSLKGSKEILSKREEIARQTLDKARELYMRINNPEEDVDEIIQEALKLGIKLDDIEVKTGKVKAGPVHVHSPFREYRSVHGHRILVGRSARDNHYLTFKVAASSDIWLHANNIPSAHVVLVRDKKGIFDMEDIKDAATLTLYFSKARNDGKGEIMYTPRRYVKPLPGKGPGEVRVKTFKVIYIPLDENRLKRLMTTEK